MKRVLGLLWVMVFGALPVLAEGKSPVREGPRVLAGASVEIGRHIPDMPVTPLAGQPVALKSLMGKQGLVIAFTNTTCPICKKYGPTLGKLQETLLKQDIAMVFVNPMANEKPAQMQAFIKQHQLTQPYIHDATGTLAKTLGVSSTAAVVLLDRQRTVIYQGAVDDQYGLGYSLDAPKRAFLMDAIQAMKANRQPDPVATTAPGCELDLASAKAITPPVTYHNRISRIIQANCIECHRTGGVGPFSLEKPDDVIAHAGMIRKVVDQGTMPPWFANSPKTVPHSPWANDRTLSAASKNDLFAWLKSDRPLGDAAEAPLARTFAGGWLIGKPDAVFEFAKPVAVKATGTMPYQNITVDTQLTEDRWVKGIEVRPSAREVVHHVLVFVLPPGKGDDAGNERVGAEERQGFFAAYVPGQSVFKYPENFAKRLPKGSRLRFQMHYTPNGKATEDKTQIGLVYAEKPPQFEVKVVGIVNVGLSIPARADNHPEVATLRVPFNATALAFMPHMHLRGKAFRYEVTLPGEKPETILDIPHYDFNWQLYYRLAEPKLLTPGTVVKATGWFDNSTNNPANPNPDKVVRWGPQTTDEMMLGYLEYYIPVGESNTIPAGPRANVDLTTLMKLVDKDADGVISRAEYDAFIKFLPNYKNNPDEAKKLFERLDADGDGKISATELKKLRDR